MNRQPRTEKLLSSLISLLYKRNQHSEFSGPFRHLERGLDSNNTGADDDDIVGRSYVDVSPAILPKERGID
jgi:hypothetical protein